ncbi:hypothetical protein ACFORH_39100 [Amycolatopsis roodepoortensis]|uniref:Uncharacterized protein n=1 Tax=Amycolatopsis roodepoortensis TaxID=700274 RepID=A0ABR9LIN2_9PSEU|nr:hypothetical protein [Amycolatopsis roodepoortensis]MBE1580524.1 hypothetical protein [Amycolatopsis roodepoortensis]
MTDPIPALARWNYLDPRQQHQVIQDGRSTFVRYQAFTATIRPAESLTDALAAVLTIELLEHQDPAAASAYYSGLTRRARATPPGPATS